MMVVMKAVLMTNAVCFPARNCHRNNSEFRTVLEAPMPYLYECQIRSREG